MKQSEIQYDSLEILLSDLLLQTETNRHKDTLKKVTDAFDTCVCFQAASQTTSAIITRLSKALQVLELEGMETKRKGKTVLCPLGRVKSWQIKLE